MFRAADSRGVPSSSAANAAVLGAGQTLTAHGTELMTVHQNTITSVRAYEGPLENVTKVSTTGVDGRLVIWPVSGVAAIARKVGSMHV